MNGKYHKTVLTTKMYLSAIVPCHVPLMTLHYGVQRVVQCQYSTNKSFSVAPCPVFTLVMGYHSRVSAAFSAENWCLASRAVYPDPSVSGDQQIISFVGRLHFTCLLLPAADLGSQPDGPLVGLLPPPPWQFYW